MILDKLIVFDAWCMRFFFGGLRGETMSAAAWNAHLTKGWFGWTYLIINALFYFLQKDHCRKAWEWQQDLYK